MDSNRSNFKEYIKNTLILHGFDPYSSLNYLIHDYFSKFVSLVIVLTLIRVFSMTLQIRFIRKPCGNSLLSSLPLLVKSFEDEINRLETLWIPLEVRHLNSFKNSFKGTL